MSAFPSCPHGRIGLCLDCMATAEPGPNSELTNPPVRMDVALPRKPTMPTDPAAPPPMARIIDGHPVPYSLTVEPGDRSELTTDEVRRAAERWLAESKPQMRIVRIDGHYVYYDYAGSR